MSATDDQTLSVLHVREGAISDTGSWVYVWLRVDGDRRVVYVGSTGLPPEVRTWLHLHDPDPDVGRLAVRYPSVQTHPLDVIALPISPHESREEVRAHLAAALAREGLLSEAYVGDAPGVPDPSGATQVEAIVAYVREHVSA